MFHKDVGDVLAFPNVKDVVVTNCPRLKSVFSSASITKYIKNIVCLEVDEQSEIFPVDEESKLGDQVYNYIVVYILNITYICKKFRCYI